MTTPLTRNREFLTITTTEAFSVVGDQLSRVALALLIFERTGSAGLSGLTYGLTYLPTVLGGLLLSQLADRRPRRDVSVAIDATRAAIVLAMATPGLPLAMLCCLVALSSFLSGPYAATRLALLRDVLPQQQYGRGLAVRQALSQGGQLVGFCAGGLLAAAYTPITCLVIDGLTFAVAALLVRSFVRSRPPVAAAGAAGSVLSTSRFIWQAPALRAVLLSTFFGLLLTAPKALSVPLAFELHLGSRWAGLFMASEGLFAIVVLGIFARIVPVKHYAKAFPLACLTPGVPMVAAFALHDPYLVILTFGASGSIWAVLTVVAASSFADLLPPEQRGRGMGIAASTNSTSQGLGAFLGGLIADQIGSRLTITLFGLACLLLALIPVRLWNRSVLAPRATAPETSYAEATTAGSLIAVTRGRPGSSGLPSSG